MYGTCNGKVFQAGYDKSYGNFVVVMNMSDGSFHWYCHLETIFVKQGQNVSRATVIGVMGNTGNSTGVHLHFEIRKPCNCYDNTINPAEYIGIENKTGWYDSRNFNIDVEIKQGDIVSIPCKFTGATNEGSSLIEVLEKQFWIYNSSLNKDKTQVKAIVCYIDKDKIMVELDLIGELQKQFWVDKNEIIFY